MRWLLLGSFWIGACAAPIERGPLPVAPVAKKSPTPMLSSAAAPTSAPSPVYLASESFSPSGNTVVYWDQQGLATVASLADCRLIARVAESPEHAVSPTDRYEGDLVLPSDDELVIIYPDPDKPPGYAERRALPSGAVLDGGPAYARFATPLGPAYFDVQLGAESSAPEHAQLVLHDSATPRRINLLPKFGGIDWLRLSVLTTLGNTLVVHLEGAIGALSVQRVGTIELTSGAVKVAPTLVATTGAVAVAKNRVALVQEDDSPVFVYELPSLRRLSVTREPGLTEQRYEQFSLGQPYSCVALSPDASVVAAYRDDTGLRWYDATSGKRLGELHEPDVPDFDSPELCRLAFTADGRRLVLATDKGTVLVASVADSKLLLSFTWGKCEYVSHETHCDGQSILSADARFFVALDPQPKQDRAQLVDLESGQAHDLGPVTTAQMQLDPSGRYLVLGGRVWSTSPLRSLCTLP